MDFANTTNVEFIVDSKVLFHGWWIYSYLHIFKLIRWLPGECADWLFDNIMTWSYCVHRRYSMSRQKNNILINEHALNCELVPLMPHCPGSSKWRNGGKPPFLAPLKITEGGPFDPHWPIVRINPASGSMTLPRNCVWRFSCCICIFCLQPCCVVFCRMVIS